MAKLNFQKGTTAKVARIYIQNSTSSSGSGLTGITAASSGLVAHYLLEGSGTPVTISLSAGTAGSWSSGGFVEVSSSSMPGVYELGLPNAALSGANSCLVMLSGVANMVPVLLELQLEAVNNEDGAAYGLSAVPISLTQAIPTSNTAQTVGDALNAARAQGLVGGQSVVPA